jgi:energy-converting hydrogenase Eha subunit F
MVVSAVGYFFSIIAVFTTIMAFMALLIGVLNPSTFEKVRHYPHPRPIIERTVPSTNPDTPAADRAFSSFILRFLFQIRVEPGI